MIERSTEWWWQPEYDKPNIMNFPDRRADSLVRRVTDDTDPVLYRHSNGALRLKLERPHPQRPKVRIYTEGTMWIVRR